MKYFVIKRYYIYLFVVLFAFSLYFLYDNYQNKDIKDVKISIEKINSFVISEKNAEFIKLNNREYSIPFHPIRIIKIQSDIYYIDSGKIYKINSQSKKIVEIKIPYKSQEIVNLALFNNKIYFLDKLNIIYVYDLSNKKFIQKYNFNYIKDIEPQFISIKSNNKVYILDNSQNIIFSLENNKIIPFKFKKLENIIQYSNFDLTESVDFYKENNDFYVLNRGNILKIISNNVTNEYNLNQKNDIYNYLRIFSDKNLKNIYFIGGYNGSIKSFSKLNKKVEGNYFIKYKNTSLAVYDLFIENNVLYILADNYLIIYDNFRENNFNLLRDNFDYDLLDKSLEIINLKNIRLPLDNGSSLPLHASVYPGARRLYRTGIHEGIDFFENVNINTPVISCKKGIVIRVDKNYKNIDKKTHENILKKCKDLGYTPSDIADLLRGRQVVIKHENNLISVYSHLSKVNSDLEIGQEVDEGDILGYIGNSGTKDDVNKTNKGLHLHFELHINDKSKNLEYYLGKYLSVEESMQIYQKIMSN